MRPTYTIAVEVSPVSCSPSPATFNMTLFSHAFEPITALFTCISPHRLRIICITFKRCV